MDAELFTPRVLARIRERAVIDSALKIAESLNWPVPRLERVCNAHGIPLHGPFVLRPEALPADENPLVDEGLTNLLKALPQTDARVLSILMAVPVGQCATGENICVRLNLSARTVEQAIRRLRFALGLRGLRWEIQGRRGKPAGYRLAPLKS